MFLFRPEKAHNDPDVFATLFERYKNLVYKTAYLMLGETAEADEALQEVFVLVYRSLGQYDPQKGAMSTWLYRITINYCLGLRRKPSVACEPFEELTLAAENEPLESSLEKQGERENIRQAIATLGAKQRAVVILRYYWELPYAEIATILDLPLGTVKSRLDLALRCLRQKLTGETVEKINLNLPEMEMDHEL